MKLTEQDKQILREVGHPESDMRQLSEAARRCKYQDYNDDKKKLTAAEVINRIGRKYWLYGISRAAFHWTTSRTENGQHIGFDCSAMFK